MDTTLGLCSILASNEVTDLQNKNYTNSSMTLIWSPPQDPYSHFYTYWVQWASEEETQRKRDLAGHETKS